MTRVTLIKISAVIWGLSGIVIVAAVVIPIVSYEKTFSSKKISLISPIIENKKSTLGSSEVDYTKASNWFESSTQKENFSATTVSFYTLSIPKLNIENATVGVGGEDLAESLIQYPGTALPGKKGNSVIFGHSILAIFSTLPSLKKGDNIFVNYDGVSYQYEVEEKFEVTPYDIQVLEQDSRDSFLTLVTCVPPGDPRKPKRLIVRARVVPWDKSNANIGH